MDQAILVDADIDESTEVGDVGDHPFKHHARDQVFDLVDPFGEGGGLEFRARVAAGLIKLADDIGDRRQADFFVGIVGSLDTAKEIGVADDGVERLVIGCCDVLDYGIGFRVDCRAIKRFLPPMIRRKPAHCSKAFGPRRATFFRVVRLSKRPFSSR